MQSLITRSFNRFATLNAQYIANKSRNAVRFEAQNTIWDFEELNHHTMAFAKGLSTLNFRNSIYILMWHLHDCI